MIRIQNRPTIDAETAAALAEEHFGLVGRATPLPGERDRNFLLEGAGERHVVKVTSPQEPDDVLDFESRLLEALEHIDNVPTPELRRTREGDAVLRHPAGDGSVLRVRVLEHLPGSVLGEAAPRSRGLLSDLGRKLAALGDALARHGEAPPPREGFDWALARAGDVMERGLDLLDGRPQALVERVLTGFRDAEEDWRTLPRQLIHGDVNDHNVLVSDPTPDPDHRRVTGILDFGDAHPAPRVFDLAIACAYALLDQPDPLDAAAAVVAGYHGTRALEPEELEVLFPLIRARLGASVCISAWRRRESEEVDPYLTVSEAPAWQALEALDAVHPRLARGLFRDACGMPACPRSQGLAAWLESREAAPVVALPGGAAGLAALDLSVGSPLLTGRDTDDTEAFTRRVFGAMEEAGASVGIGRYDEPRAFYLTDAFAGPSGELPERRTVHLGVDLFVEPGENVMAPLDGVVASVADNAARLDYGPTVILEHQGPDGPFWTLYGHLERASVEGLEPGAEVTAGQAFARVGPYPENGDWPPHLHFQIVTDRLGFREDFPGVAPPRHRRVWTSFSPNPEALLGLPVDVAHRDAHGLEERRARLLGSSLSLSYRRPIHVVRGLGAHLYDAEGRAYLDCVNNVAHVGHEHPRVVEALKRQAGVLNTNTRYLHEAVLEYAEGLLALFGDSLEVAYFVNSGSEANELALRMARAHTAGTGIVVLEGGYHGNTQGLVEVSHYKFAGPGGRGAPEHVRAVPMPEEYRGRYRRDDPERAEKYAAHVAEAFRELADAGHRPAAFLCESILSCGGQVEPPQGYLQAAFRHAREAGAVCIADEVQVGFGRVGSHWWGFETQGAAPDIVTLGKPMGNGHPVGGVVASRGIAESFANGMEFFSTFGGNPVSAAVGLAVLEVLKAEGLREHALDVGTGLKHGLAGLMERHPVVGDVRGRGLFLGVELVADPEERRPSADAARYAAERMKERGVLLSTDGPDHNVLKIKPPLPFSAEDAERVVEGLDAVLAEDFVRELVGG